ncbi:hypothetical protein P691DRAFT_802734, partial [Macrolepiota fuliginosa MF-IS2]
EWRAPKARLWILALVCSSTVPKSVYWTRVPIMIQVPPNLSIRFPTIVPTDSSGGMFSRAPNN